MDKEEQELIEAFRSMTDESRLRLLWQTQFALTTENAAKKSVYQKLGIAFNPAYEALEMKIAAGAKK